MIVEFLKGETASALGWTLLHSVWQVMVILLAVKAALRWFPTRAANVRYAIACAGIFAAVVTSAITFAHIHTRDTAMAPELLPAVGYVSHSVPEAMNEKFTPIQSITYALDQSIPWLLTAWAAGLLFFSMRYTGGLLYTEQLRSSATLLQNEWALYIDNACERLGIRRRVALGESSSIHTPVVIGYLKPMILAPVGMLGGLSHEQVETILLHELAHIRRHDHLVNFIQCAVETLFFFNPFLWMLSDVVKKEREYCCDDFVIHHHGAARAYAFALARLEEHRLSGHPFALGLANNRNELLTRIRRIMETSVKQQSKNRRMLVPAILLFSALLCISWLGIRQDTAKPLFDDKVAEQDTIVPEKQNTARYSRRSIITLGEDGQPHEEIIEEFEGDESLRPLLENQVPDISSFFPAQPPQIHSAPFNFSIPNDTIPNPFGPESQKHWDEFAKRFEENFRMNFGDLFNRPGSSPFGMLEQMEERFGLRGFEGWDSSFHFNLPPDLFEGRKMFSDSTGSLEDALKRLEEFQLDHLRNFNFGPFSSDGAFWNERDLRRQLIEDGYLQDDETIESMEWNNETFKVNGKKIEESDAKKYREHFNRQSPGGME